MCLAKWLAHTLRRARFWVCFTSDKISFLGLAEATKNFDRSSPYNILILMLFYHCRHFAFLFILSHSFSIHCTPHFQQIHYDFTFYLSTSNVHIHVINFFWFTMFYINLEHPKNTIFPSVSLYLSFNLFGLFPIPWTKQHRNVMSALQSVNKVCQKLSALLVEILVSLNMVWWSCILAHINFTCIIAYVVLMLTMTIKVKPLILA